MAAFGRRRGRPPHPDLLTPSEERVLALVCAGRTNSEIANELHISVSGVKYHVTNMLGKLGLADRAALAEWREDRSQEEGGRPSVFPGASLVSLWKAGLAGAGLVAAGAATFAVAGLFTSANDAPELDGDIPAGYQAPVIFTGAPEFNTGEIPAGYEALTAAGLEARGMIDVGLLLRTHSGAPPVSAGQLRESLSVAVIAAPVEVVEGQGAAFAFNFQAAFANAVYLKGADGEPIRVTLWATGKGFLDEANIIAAADGTRTISPAAGPARVMLSVTDASTGTPIRAGIASNGHLFVDPQPLPAAMVVDEWTGSALGVAEAAEGYPLGPIGAGLFRFTGCEAEIGTCSVSFRAFEALPAPFAGMLRCLDRETVEIVTSEFTLRIQRVNTGYGGSADFSCEPHAVAAGQVIGDRGKHWEYTAFAPSGRQISAGVSFDGRFFVGEFAPAVGCPCLTGT